MPTLIDCIDRQGNVNQFQYEIEIVNDDEEREWIFRVTSPGRDGHEWYEFRVKQVDATTAKVVMMNNHNITRYRGKGITEKLIEEANKVTRLSIISSTNIAKYKAYNDEYITTAAEKVWERLVSQGRAEQNETTKIFKFLP